MVMAHEFDKGEATGAVLEYVALHHSTGAARRSAWEQANLLGSHPDVWRGPGASYRLLVDMLSVGRAGRSASVQAQVGRILRKLLAEMLVEPLPEDDNLRTEYLRITPLGSELLASNAFVEYLGGPRTIVERWRRAVCLVYGTAGGCGTGFLVDGRVVTAQHVVDEVKGTLRVAFDDKDVEIGAPFRAKDASLDLAMIPLLRSADVPPFQLSEVIPDLLEEVVILGHPPVARTREAVMLANRGEVSALAMLYEGTQVILVSSLLRGGYSGGPVLDRRGRVVGFVTKNLIKQRGAGDEDVNEALGVAAVIPASWIAELLAGRLPVEGNTT